MLSMLLALLLPLAHAQEPPVQEAIAVDAQLVVKVKHPQAVADALVSHARELGGYFSKRTHQQVVFRIPTAHVDGFIDHVDAQGLVVSRSLTNTGLTRNIADAKARLAARESVLARYFSVLDEAGADSVVTVERTIVGLIEQIEHLKGRIRAMEHQAAYADVVVDFQFRDRAAPVRDGSSSFAWLNTVNLEELIEAFHYGYPAEGSRRFRGACLPEGFAPYDISRESRAISPDGVMLRVRAERHEPVADLDFWEEALLERMAAAGYLQQGDPTRMTVSGVAGSTVTFHAPLGVDDYTYQVAVFPLGKSLVIVEAAGEISTFEQRSDAIQAAIAALSL